MSLIRGLAIALAAVLAAATAASLPAAAAQIEVTNCQPKQVRMCAYDANWHGDLEVAGKHVLSEGESGHYTCKANCQFWISDPCQNGKCADCGAITYGTWLDHSWGKGNYQLVSLAKTGSGGGQSHYKSSDLVKVEEGAACP